MSVATIHLTADQIASAASVAVASSNDRIAPVIGGVHLTVSAGRLDAIATDRYRIARVQFPLATEEGAQDDIDGVTIPAKFLADFVKSVRALKLTMAGVPVTLTFDSGDDNEPDYSRTKLVTLTYAGMVTMSAAPISGNFPPVARLIPDESGMGDATQINLRMDWLADAAKIVLPGDSKAKSETALYSMRFTKTSNPNKPGPVLLTREDSRNGLGALAQYMVQPNLILR